MSSSIDNGQIHFEKLVSIYNTTGKCFTYWSESMALKDRHDVCHYLALKEFMWAKVLDKVSEFVNI